MICTVLTTVAGQAASETDTARAEAVPLREAITRLAVADEVRDGYDHAEFRHWIDADRDGCSTRAEVLLQEANTAPQVAPHCDLSGGRWYSYYDDTHVDGPQGLDIDHMVPLAEAWDSGAFDWTAQRRQSYANDLDEPAALVAVTARSNRGKADRDPASWLPPHAPAVCRYVAEWVTVKLRWGLTVDTVEHDALIAAAAQCPNDPITVRPA
ncbi:hypothetical protein ADK67_33780 [Saccharothrix sp. NRRL B-16348]|nr:hypothetical protein ADK67_33780 [Saccharothrix sp. NRRL B-16348]